MKVLWHSNAPWSGTGYGRQTALFAKLFQEAGHDVAIHAFYGLSGSILDFDGIRLYPGGTHPYGNDTLAARAAAHFGNEAGLVLTLIDAWVLDPALLSQLNVACWTPIDHEPAPPEVVRVLEASGAAPIAMSRHGERMLAEAGLTPSYVPHGIDTEIFCPGDQAAARRELNLPESAFVVGMVAANKGYPARKGFAEAIAGFARLQAEHDDAFLLLHTEPVGAVQGINLPAILAHYKIPPERVSLSGVIDWTTALPDEFMAGLYRSCDVLLNPSYGEGFGIPVLEAQACGVPVIVTDWTAMREVGDIGWHVGGQEFWTVQNALWKIPDIEQIAWALGEAHTMAHRMGEAARQHALAYDARRVMEEHWTPVLSWLEAKFFAEAYVESYAMPVAS